MANMATGTCGIIICPNLFVENLAIPILFQQLSYKVYYQDLLGCESADAAAVAYVGKRLHDWKSQRLAQ